MRPITIAEYETLARQRLHPAVWDYYSAGADDEVTLRENRAAFERLRLRPHTLVDVSAVDLRTHVLGHALTMPIGLAPTATHGAACVAGEQATAQAAGVVGTLMIASTESTCSMEEIAAVATGPLWYQLYFSGAMRARAERLVRRAEAAGYSAIAVTVDSPRWGRKERSIRSEDSYDWPLRGNFRDEPHTPDDENIVGDAAVTWDDIAWLQALSPLPIILKGILTGEDAALAVGRGVAGIIVSNHGGRQLDGASATIDALPEVVAAVASRCEIYLDGGVRRGTDVLKALALGARAVFVGRPVLWGLTVHGAAGAQHTLEILRDELALAMALSGCPRVADLDETLIQRAAQPLR